ncbi:MAG TPA: NFACT RNA binding domain-containing protein [Clostridiaceae bacterium]|nr:NFACT RNA binding domain-containing protein [Clostridiaceae bacterium]
MALDGIYISNLVEEIREGLVDTRVDKVNQPESDVILLQFRSRGANRKLLLTSNSTYSRLHFTSIARQNPMKAPLFLMVLRKYLQGARLLDIRQLDGDRVVNITFSGKDDMGYDQNYILSIEMMGRHSNIILIRERDMKIVECIKHVSADRNSYRTLLPGSSYILPPPSPKLDPMNYTDEELTSAGDPSNLDPEFFSRVFSGISRKTSERIHGHYKGEEPYAFIRNILLALGKSNSFYIMKKGDEYLDVLSYPFEGGELIPFDSPSEALEVFVNEKDQRDRIRGKSSDLQKLVQTNIDRVKKKIHILEESIRDSEDKDMYRLKGELLTANIYSLKEGMDRATLLNYYDDTLMDIDLNPNKSISYNVQRYYSKYNKKKRAEEMAKSQKILALEELDYLTSILISLTNSENQREIEDIRQELVVAGYLRFRKVPMSKEKPSKPLHFRSSEGIDIFVGKNNTQNDQLTLKFADKHDTWLHTKNIPGSHVIIKALKFSDETLLEAANLAAYYSKASSSTKVPVDYTEVKNVKKPSGAKPGMVIYSTNKTLYVDPEATRLERIE